jgi:thiaminase
VLACATDRSSELVVLDASGTALASAVLALDPTEIATVTGLPASRLDRVAWIVDLRRAPGPAGERAQDLALYAALQRARLADRQQIGVTVVDDDTPLSRALGLAPLDAPAIDVPGRGSFRPRAQRVDVALARTFAAAQSAEDPIAPDFLVREVDAFLRGYFERMWRTQWFRAVQHDTLTRTQYVYTLSNMHQFVRFTTRILARCVAASDDAQLRLHFLRHLQGEINHEVIIERDLAVLGEDVAYVVDRMSPNLATRQFMAAQEAAIGFHRDPVLLMAAPLAAEGISGHLDGAFMEALHRNVARWGVSEPERVTRFYSSHIDYDGGDDGHWETTMAMLAQHLRSETALARFLSMLRVTTDAMLRCYDSWIDEMPL